MTSQITVDSALNDEVKKMLSSDVLQNELDLTKEINARDHPNLVPARFSTKGSSANDRIGFNPNDISGIPMNDDLLRSEKEISGTFIGTQDLKEALGFMKGKTSAHLSWKDVDSRNTDSMRKESKGSAGGVASTMKDPFSPRNANLQSPFALKAKINQPKTAPEFGSSNKFEFPQSIRFFCDVFINFCLIRNFFFYFQLI